MILIPDTARSCDSLEVTEHVDSTGRVHFCLLIGRYGVSGIDLAFDLSDDSMILVPQTARFCAYL